MFEAREFLRKKLIGKKVSVVCFCMSEEAWWMKEAEAGFPQWLCWSFNTLFLLTGAQTHISEEWDVFHSPSECQAPWEDALRCSIGLDAPFKQAVLIPPLLRLLICWVCRLEGCSDFHTSDPVEPVGEHLTPTNLNTYLILLILNRFQMIWADIRLLRCHRRLSSFNQLWKTSRLTEGYCCCCVVEAIFASSGAKNGGACCSQADPGLDVYS